MALKSSFRVKTSSSSAQRSNKETCSVFFVSFFNVSECMATVFVCWVEFFLSRTVTWFRKCDQKLNPQWWIITVVNKK